MPLNSGTRSSGLGARKEKISNTISDKGQMTSDQGQRTYYKGQVTSSKMEPSIAVLPFTNMSPDEDQDYFADGIAEEILYSLTRVKELEVRGRTSSFYFKGRNEDLPTISKMLNVKYILEGSVRKARNQVRITVQMINTQSIVYIYRISHECGPP